MKINSFILLFVLFPIMLQAQFFQFDQMSGLIHADIVSVDIDNDGDLDVIVSGETTENNVKISKSIIYINDKGTFTPQSTNSSSYQNPVFTPDLADPTVIKANDGWFYAYGTENTWTNEKHHIVPIIKSKN